MRWIKRIEEVFWQLFAPFSVIKVNEKKSKTAGGAVKEHEDSTGNATEGF